MRFLLAALWLLAACTRPGFGPVTPEDRITLSLSGSTTGGYSLIVTPDDRVVYDAYANRAAPNLPGWRWGDAQRVSGQAARWRCLLVRDPRNPARRQPLPAGAVSASRAGQKPFISS